MKYEAKTSWSETVETLKKLRPNIDTMTLTDMTYKQAAARYYTTAQRHGMQVKFSTVPGGILMWRVK